MAEGMMDGITMADYAISKWEYIFGNNKEAGKVEITDGTWDKERGIYTTEDRTSGIITEYHVKKSMKVTSGHAIYERSYKVVKDENGLNKRVPVRFDTKRNEWVQKGAFKQFDEKFEYMNPKIMGTLVETKGQNGSTFSLQIERARSKLGVMSAVGVGVNR